MKRFGCGLLVVLAGCTLNGKAFGPSLSTSSSSGSSPSSSSSSREEEKEDPKREAERRAGEERQAQKVREAAREDAALDAHWKKREAEQAAKKQKEDADDAARASQKAYCETLKFVDDAPDRTNADTKALAAISGCSNELPSAWYLEEKADASQIWHLAATLACYGRDHEITVLSPIPTEKLKSSWNLTRFAHCSYDGKQLDRAKFEAELKAKSNVTPQARARLLGTFDTAKAFVDMTTATYKSLAKEDPLVLDIAFTAPEAAFREWTENYGKLKTDFDLVIDVERRADTSKSALKGCAAKLRPAFIKMLAERKPKEYREYVEWAQGPFQSRLIAALAFCEMIDGDETTATLLSRDLTGERGPRALAATAALAKIVQARQDNPKFSTEPQMFKPDGDRHPDRLEIKNRIVGTSERGGIVAKVEPKDGRVVITFKSTSWMEEVVSCTDTKKIDRIDSSGTLIYRKKCVPAGKEKRTWNERAVTVSPAYAGAIKPGQFLMILRKWNEREFYSQDEPLWGALPIGGYSDTNKSKLVTFMGQAL